MALFSFEIDPHKVLGVTAQASLQEIRDAYKQKAKRFHPDGGGEEWAFRILVQAYEMLSSARVARATRVETPPPAAHATSSQAGTRRRVGPCRNSRQRRRAVSDRRGRALLRALSLGRRRVPLAHPARSG